MELKVVSSLDVETEKLATAIIDCAFQVHAAMGPGLLEKIYEECLICEFRDRNIRFERQKPILLNYKTHKLDLEYKLDLLVDDRIVVELKNVEQLSDLHKAQILSYMKLFNKRLGLLINFNAPLIKQGIKRVVL